MSAHRVGDPQSGAVPLRSAHCSVIGQGHVMPVVVDRAAELGHPESDSVVGELQQDALELGPRERPLWFRDHKCVPAPTWVPQVSKDPGGLRAPFPRQAAALVDVVIGGDDLTVRRNEPSRRVCLPAKAVCRVLKIVSRGARTQREADHAASFRSCTRRARTMRARAAATSRFISGSSTAMKSIDPGPCVAEFPRSPKLPLAC